MNITYGGRVHAPNPAAQPARPSPLCGRAAKHQLRPDQTSCEVNCISCLKQLGQEAPESARAHRVVWGETSGFGWTPLRPGRYQADVPGHGGLWWLDRINGSWYLTGPGSRSYGPMRGPDGDRRLKAAIDAASAPISDYTYEG